MNRSFLCLCALAAQLLAQPAGIFSKNVQGLKVPSQSLGEERTVNVLLPRDYENSTRRYPVLYLLHGLGDNQNAWPLRTDLSAYAARYPLIVVMPDGGRSFYVNSAADPKARFEDFIVGDLIPFVDAHYRTIPLRRGRAMAGLSMGGFGTMFLGLKHSNLFAVLGSFSAPIGIAREPARSSADETVRTHASEIQAVLGLPDMEKAGQRDPFVQAAKIELGNLPALYLSCGSQDTLVGQNRAFVQALAARNMAFEYREVSPAYHNWNFWDREILVFLKFLARQNGFMAE